MIYSLITIILENFIKSFPKNPVHAHYAMLLKKIHPILSYYVSSKMPNFTGILRVLPLGLFLLSMLVSGVSGAATTTPQSSTASSTSQPSSTTNEGDMTENGTTKIYCPSFNCNYSDCYSMYISQNTTPCAVDNCCQLLRQTDMWYTASCSNSCADSCKNASQTNCAVNCCNFTGCLNYTFASMMSITTNGTQTTKPTTTQAPTTTTTSQTTANNGNKCSSGTCTSANCYTSFTILQMCSSSEPHCQLKNESTDTATKWTAGCTNCTGYTACKASTKPPCNLECCNATMTSCLWLNGTLNVPSFATRGPYLHTELIASLLCIVAIAFLL
ncbi:integumentary mucin C.1 isoform X1 [Haplochromis burtoni]|uniref:integumentary mucin C.1 isoform X1 n=1 Tax=Haplochromis burtoni TaxID=8153 RepID=UPI001C2D5495|nr:integumentary mucin C.1 isoform X1 [Haplochromis burtoni]